MKHLIVAFLLGVAAKYLLFPDKDGVPLPTVPHPQLNWYLKGPKIETKHDPNEHGAGAVEELESTTPFVIIDNILHPKLLSALIEEIKSSQHGSYRTEEWADFSDNDPRATCRLKRDGEPCGVERWLDFDFDDAKKIYYGGNYNRMPRKKKKKKNAEENVGRVEPRDIFDQVIMEIAKHDMVDVLPEYVAKHGT